MTDQWQEGAQTAQQFLESQGLELFPDFWKTGNRGPAAFAQQKVLRMRKKSILPTITMSFPLTVLWLSCQQNGRTGA